MLHYCHECSWSMPVWSYGKRGAKRVATKYKRATEINTNGNMFRKKAKEEVPKETGKEAKGAAKESSSEKEKKQKEKEKKSSKSGKEGSTEKSKGKGEKDKRKEGKDNKSKDKEEKVSKKDKEKKEDKKKSKEDKKKDKGDKKKNKDKGDKKKNEDGEDKPSKDKKIVIPGGLDGVAQIKAIHMELTRVRQRQRTPLFETYIDFKKEGKVDKKHLGKKFDFWLVRKEKKAAGDTGDKKQAKDPTKEKQYRSLEDTPPAGYPAFLKFAKENKCDKRLEFYNSALELDKLYSSSINQETPEEYKKQFKMLFKKYLSEEASSTLVSSDATKMVTGLHKKYCKEKE